MLVFLILFLQNCQLTNSLHLIANSVYLFESKSVNLDNLRIFTQKNESESDQRKAYILKTKCNKSSTLFLDFSPLNNFCNGLVFYGIKSDIEFSVSEISVKPKEGFLNRIIQSEIEFELFEENGTDLLASVIQKFDIYSEFVIFEKVNELRVQKNSFIGHSFLGILHKNFKNAQGRFEIQFIFEKNQIPKGFSLFVQGDTLILEGKFSANETCNFEKVVFCLQDVQTGLKSSQFEILFAENFDNANFDKNAIYFLCFVIISFFVFIAFFSTGKFPYKNLTEIRNLIFYFFGKFDLRKYSKQTVWKTSNLISETQKINVEVTMNTTLPGEQTNKVEKSKRLNFDKIIVN